MAVPAVPMVGVAALTVGWRWRSPLRGHVQWAHEASTVEGETTRRLLDWEGLLGVMC
jgi:hypothetical protein